jgi:hypothetical protein
MTVIHSLRFRLVLAFALVVIVAIGTASLFASRTSRGEIRQYQQRTCQIMMDKCGCLLLQYYSSDESWTNVQPLVEHMAALYGQRLILADDSGMVVADSELACVGMEYDRQWLGEDQQVQHVENEDDRLATLYMGPEPRSEANPASIQSLFSLVNRSLLWGGLFGLAAALMITLFLSQRMSAPIRALTVAARRLGQGDF